MHKAREEGYNQASSEFSAKIANLQENNNRLQAESKAKDKCLADKDAKLAAMEAENARLRAQIAAGRH